MRRTLITSLLVAVTGMAPACAQAAGSSSSSGSSSSGLGLLGAFFSETMIPVEITGTIDVTFHSDPAGGCAQLAGCAYSGRIIANPAGEAMIVRAPLGGQTLTMFGPIGSASGPVAPTVFASVQRALPGGGSANCVDGAGGDGGFGSPEPAADGSVTVSFAPLLSAERCAAPAAADFGNAAPQFTLTRAMLAHGQQIFDLHGTRTFAAGGFAGTMTSTLVVKIGAPSNLSALLAAILGAVGQGGKPQKVREVTMPLTLTGGGGVVTAAIYGTAKASVCVLLDSCGIVGTLTVTARPSALHVLITAMGPASRPYADFLTALGQSNKGRPAGIAVMGVGYGSDSGSIQAQLKQQGQCTDSAPLTESIVAFESLGHELQVGYGPAGAGGALRTRCPGLLLASSQLQELAQATVPLARLRKREFTVVVRAGGTTSDDGYTATLSGQVQLTFRRGAITQQVFAFPAG